MLAYELLSLLVIICCWCSHALRNKDIWIVSVLHGNLEHAFPSPFPQFYLILVMYWHISPLESTEGPLASFPGTEQFSGLQISWRRWHGKGKIHLQISGLSSVHNNVCTLPSHSFVKFQMCDHMFCWIYRGGGFISLENLLYFSKNFPVSKNHSTQVLVHIHRLNISAMLLMHPL